MSAAPSRAGATRRVFPIGPGTGTGTGTGSLDVLEAGDGPLLGHLHGMLGNPGVPPLVAELSARHRVVAPSLPGFDRTPGSSDLRSMHDWVVALGEIVDVAGIAGTPLVATSIGAMLALELAAVRPEAVGRLVLVAPLGLWDDADPVADPFGTTLGEQRAMLTADPATSAPFYDLDPSLPAGEQVEEGVRRYVSRRTVASLVWPIPDHGLAGRLHRVRCPVTLIWGSADRLCPPTYARRFADLLPSVAGVYFVDGAGHHADWDRPVEVAALVEAALAS
ncbi:MAG: alpha/beta fold hydrolase [Acidimicrobiales bacterium]|nr:alpha/beta fold hydrolase [Acidimicrobiales bacterium]